MNAIKALSIELAKVVKENGRLKADLQLYKESTRDLQRRVSDLITYDHERDDRAHQLEERIARRDETIRNLLQRHVGSTIPIPEFVEEYPSVADKIPLIKRVREEYGFGLKEAKDLVDSWQAKGLWPNYDAPHPTSTPEETAAITSAIAAEALKKVGWE